MSRNFEQETLQYIQDHPGSSSSQIHEGLTLKIGFSTLKRILSKLSANRLIESEGKGRNTRYRLTTAYEVLHPIDVELYFRKEIDERIIREQFNFSLIEDVLPQVRLFTEEEKSSLMELHEKFRRNVSHFSTTEYNKEMERLAIDLSWKSSQIEGNTYSLLETERLLKDKQVAEGKPKSDATMLLNHKDAINFILENKDYLHPLTIRAIKDIHSLLVKDLGVERNIRQRRVGISGTNYKPLDNEHQIKEALEDMCHLVNSKTFVLEKALLCLILLSYIQAFVDGNKRTARIVSNAILIAHDYCPLSFRTVDAVDYKKAMLIFYEQNNISAFKNIFIRQYEFAVDTYF